LLAELGESVDYEIPIFCDNEALVNLTEGCKVMKKSRYMVYRLQLIREEVRKGSVSVYGIPGRENVADILTKPLGKDVFKKHRNRLLGIHEVSEGINGIVGHVNGVYDLAWVDAMLGFNAEVSSELDEIDLVHARAESSNMSGCDAYNDVPDKVYVRSELV
jgi:hypothetical protein